MQTARPRIARKMDVKVKTDIDLTDFEQEPLSWLASKTKDYGLKYLLAHADDGVIWGIIEGERLLTSYEAAPRILPQLRGFTLRQCRLFAKTGGELFLWRADGGWQAYYVADEPGTEVSVLDEAYVLWGDQIDRTVQSQDVHFTVVADGVQGLRHAVPLKLDKTVFQGEKNRPLYLTVRHYLKEEEETGQQFIAYSRLVDLQSEQEKEDNDGLATTE